MNGCERTRLDLGGYVLGGLEDDERQAVEAHVGGCGRCRAELDEIAVVPELLATLRSSTRRAPTDLKSRVLGRLPRHRRRTRWLVAAALVLAATVGAAGVSVLDRPPPPDAILSLRGPEPVGIVGQADLRQVDNGVRIDLDLAGVRPAGEGYYHAWLRRGDYEVSAGTFVGTPDAVARVQLLCGGRLDDYDRLTVTWHGSGEPQEKVALRADLDG